MMAPDISHPVLSDVLEAVSPEEGGLLAGVLRSRDIKAGELLFGEGEAARELFFILSGRAAVHKKSGFGGKTKVVALLEAGSVAGESVMTGKSSHGAAVAAVEDTRVCTISRSDFEKIEKECPALAVLMLKKMLNISSLRLQKSSERLALIL